MGCVAGGVTKALLDLPADSRLAVAIFSHDLAVAVVFITVECLLDGGDERIGLDI